MHTTIVVQNAALLASAVRLVAFSKAISKSLHKIIKAPFNTTSSYTFTNIVITGIIITITHVIDATTNDKGNLRIRF